MYNIQVNFPLFKPVTCILSNLYCTYKFKLDLYIKWYIIILSNLIYIILDNSTSKQA